MEYIERKLQISTGENFKESAYISDEVAALYFNWNPTEGPFIIIPSLD
jgi:calpain, invertebrate